MRNFLQTETRPLQSAVKVFFAIDALLILAHVAYPFLPLKSVMLDYLLDLNNEDGIGTWYSAVQLYSVAAIWVFVTFQPGMFRLAKPYCAGFALLFLLFSIDEITMLHENAASFLDELFLTKVIDNWQTGRVPWTYALGIPVIVTILLLGRRMIKHMHFVSRETRIALLGALVFVISATLVEFVGNRVEILQTGVGRLLQLAVEEGFELIGQTIALYGSAGVATWFLSAANVPDSRVADAGNAHDPISE